MQLNLLGVFMKMFISSLLIAATLGFVTYSPKSEAGAVLISGAAGITIHQFAQGKLYPIAGGMIGTFASIGGVSAIGGGVAMSLGFAPLGVVLIVLSEDGSSSQDQIESSLSQKYDFIGDREVITSLASAIQVKAEKMEIKDGKKIVSLSSDEVRSILDPAELSDEHINTIISDLK